MIFDALLDAGWSWLEVKLAIRHSVAVSSDSVHVIAGVVIMVGAGALLRKPLSSLAPWLAALAFAGLNELIDVYLQRWPQRDMQYVHGVKDMLLTMLLPSILLIALRYLPRLGEPVAPRGSDGD